MSPRRDRIELRVDPSTKRRLQVAADETGDTLRGFVISAAVSRADEVLPRHTAAPAEYFDELIKAMHEPPAAMDHLASAAREPRPFEVR